jgi:hypothetical protein
MMDGSGGKSEGKKPLGESSCRYEDIIKMHLKLIMCDCVDWIYLTKDNAHCINTLVLQLTKI